MYVVAKTLELATRSRRTDRIQFQEHHEINLKKREIPRGYQEVTGYHPRHLSADMYDHFASLASGSLDNPDRRPSRSVTIITFNYDLLVDDPLRRIGCSPDYHLPKVRTWIEGQDNDDSRPTCALLKLHGSTNWGICAHPSCGFRVLVLDERSLHSSAEFRTRVCDKCRQPAFQPLLIPRSWDKSEYREIMRPIWARAVEELKLASRICIIGYSMHEADSFFKYLLTLALSENHNLYKLIVVDMNPEIAATYAASGSTVPREAASSFRRTGGLSRFLGIGGSYGELGRGELVWGNVSRV